MKSCLNSSPPSAHLPPKSHAPPWCDRCHSCETPEEEIYSPRVTQRPDQDTSDGGTNLDEDRKERCLGCEERYKADSHLTKDGWISCVPEGGHSGTDERACSIRKRTDKDVWWTLSGSVRTTLKEHWGPQGGRFVWTCGV